MIPVPCVRMELAMCRMLMVFKCLLLLAFSIKICRKKTEQCSQSRHCMGLQSQRQQLLPGYWGCTSILKQKHECSSWSPGRPNPDGKTRAGKYEYGSCVTFLFAVVRCCSSDLLQGLAGQVRLRHGQPITLRGEVPHLAVGGPVMQGDGGQVVESLVQVVGHTCCESKIKEPTKVNFNCSSRGQ